jgi:hypothetical protein
MLAGQLINDELVTTQVFSDVQAGDEPIVGGAWPTVCRSSEIKIGEGHKVLSSPATGDSKAFYVVLVIGLSAILCGFAWINLSVVSALPIGSASPPLSMGSPHPELSPVSAGPKQGAHTPFAPTLDIQKGDRLRSPDTIAGEAGRDEIAEVLKGSKFSTAVHTVSFQEGPLYNGPADSAKEHRAAPKLIATPETRPTTIKGWTLREVSNGTAVLEGPNGTWRATPGQTVPGAGTVNSIVRWGNRFIVATSKGLISTP